MKAHLLALATLFGFVFSGFTQTQPATPKAVTEVVKEVAASAG